MKLLRKYFGNALNATQFKQFNDMLELYKVWNAKINVVSRKDIDNLEERHILHALSIAYHYKFPKNTHILDVGTGGGLPGLPLAVFFPEVRFHLVDSIGKKIRVVAEIIDALKLKNVSYAHQRAELVKGSFDFVVSRAVARTAVLLNWTKPKINRETTTEKGFFLLKGGDLEAELAEIKLPYQIIDLQEYFEEEFFSTKKIVYIPY